MRLIGSLALRQFVNVCLVNECLRGNLQTKYRMAWKSVNVCVLIYMVVYFVSLTIHTMLLKYVLHRQDALVILNFSANNSIQFSRRT